MVWNLDYYLSKQGHEFDVGVLTRLLDVGHESHWLLSGPLQVAQVTSQAGQIWTLF